MELVKPHKEIYDSIHGYIKLSKLACLIVDTPQFQRLRYLHQLGTCHYIFPCASHTRFEHSIGTYYLAGKVLETLKANSDLNLMNTYMLKIPELKQYYQDKDKTGCLLDSYVCELVKIAALCHDIGHGPYSHVFDDIFLKSVNKGHELEVHENRSCLLIKHIIKNNEILNQTINDAQIQFIFNLINPSKQTKGFIYQIVSNSFNSIDVDKFDYIGRDTSLLGLKYGIDVHRLIDDMIVIDNKICFPEKVYYDILSLFKTRYRLHKQIYCHKSVIAIQFMINDMMLLLDDLIGIYDSILDVDKFTDLTEDYIITYLKILYKDKNKYDDVTKNKIEKAYQIWLRVNKRDLYRLVGSFVSKSEVDLNYIMSNVDKEKCIGSKVKIGTVSGSKDNPLNKTYFYKKTNPSVCMKVSNEHVSFLESRVYQEYIYMFFTKDNTSDESIEKFKEFVNKLNE
ncbi:HD phosphohydrolase [Klosneuvirus KNV1]|uniref:HD phosphohydrolase n=1 Tax=Klosneuvirus KNV1 TaxID=1977640 RepID=A0A1V0SLI6_9VIRU|nr:HD phosphohydrolase [Klosneuvirus KNV1]